MERHWFDDEGRPALQLLDLCDVQQNYSLILTSQDFFGLYTRIPLLAPIQPIGNRLGWVWMWLKLAANHHFPLLEGAQNGSNAKYSPYRRHHRPR
jgi:hypothetical protein